jgi:hypothetical protein
LAEHSAYRTSASCLEALRRHARNTTTWIASEWAVTRSESSRSSQAGRRDLNEETLPATK